MTIDILKSSMTDLAKLIGVCVEMGITCKYEIAKTLNKSVRTVERGYAELRRDTQNREYADTRNCVMDTQNCVDKNADLRMATDDPSRARIETPSGLLNTLEEEEDARDASSISIDFFAEQLSQMIAGKLGTPEQHLPAARNCIRGQIDARGPDKVKSGLADLMAHYQAGKIKANDVWAKFSTYVANAKPNGFSGEKRQDTNSRISSLMKLMPHDYQLKNQQLKETA